VGGGGASSWEKGKTKGTVGSAWGSRAMGVLSWWMGGFMQGGWWAGLHVPGGQTTKSTSIKRRRDPGVIIK